MKWESRKEVIAVAGFLMESVYLSDFLNPKGG
jgi:hypothetical protein